MKDIKDMGKQELAKYVQSRLTKHYLYKQTKQVDSIWLALSPREKLLMVCENPMMGRFDEEGESFFGHVLQQATVYLEKHGTNDDRALASSFLLWVRDPKFNEVGELNA